MDYWNMKRADIAALEGKTLAAATKESEERIVFEVDDGTKYVMTHSQD